MNDCCKKARSEAIKREIEKLREFEWKSKTIHKESFRAGYNQCAKDLTFFLEELLKEKDLKELSKE